MYSPPLLLAFACLVLLVPASSLPPPSSISRRLSPQVASARPSDDEGLSSSFFTSSLDLPLLSLLRGGASSSSTATPSLTSSPSGLSKPLSYALSLALLYILAPRLTSLYSSLPPLRPLLAQQMAPLVALGPTAGPAAFFAIYSLYSALGLSTTPVELISGFTFPIPVALLCNALGKLAGNIAAFLFCRRFGGETPAINLGPLTTAKIRSLSSTSPLKTTLLIRFSALPDLMKNFILSTLPLSLSTFALGTLLQGGPYSCLWTLLGAQMSDATAPLKVTGPLKAALAVGVLWGLVGVPLVTGRELAKAGP